MKVAIGNFPYDEARALTRKFNGSTTFQNLGGGMHRRSIGGDPSEAVVLVVKAVQFSVDNADMLKDALGMIADLLGTAAGAEWLRNKLAGRNLPVTAERSEEISSAEEDEIAEFANRRGIDLRFSDSVDE